MGELHDLTALEQAAAIRTGHSSATELVEHYLERIDRLDAVVGAFITVTGESARAQAAAADRAVRSGERLPALHGVPIGIKDLNLTAGVRTSFGAAVLADFVPAVSDHVVDKLRAAGTISVGKTNTPEFGLPCYTENEVAPPARTPWDLTRSAGGSSGGAAAAVAAGLLPFAQGSDGGGSVRIPASVCGLVGLKVSRGRISTGPVAGDLTGLSWDGPLARTVRDAAALLDAMAGPMPGDPHWAPPPAAPFLSWADQEPGALRIGRYREPVVGTAQVHPEVVAAYEQATALLVDLGHDVVEIAAPFGPDLITHFETLWSVSAASIPVAPAHEARLAPLTQWLRARGRATSAVTFAAAVAALQGASRAAIVATAPFDAVLTPTLAGLPAPVGWFREVPPEQEFERMKGWTPFTATYNITGQPAVSLPLFWSPAGLPVGVMLVGRPADEATLISLAAQLEAARPWHHRHPALW